MSHSEHVKPDEHAYLPPSAPPRNHGHTTAAWTTVVIILVGGLVASLGVAFGSAVVAIAGFVVILLGIVVGRVMKQMGYGQPAAHDRDSLQGSGSVAVEG